MTRSARCANQHCPACSRMPGRWATVRRSCCTRCSPGPSRTRTLSMSGRGRLPNGCRPKSWPLMMRNWRESVASYASTRAMELMWGTLSSSRRYRVGNWNGGFEKCWGRTPHQQITATQLERVRQLLRETDMTLEQIALRAGYSHKERLCAVFKRETNQTPGEYRATSRSGRTR